MITTATRHFADLTPDQRAQVDYWLFVEDLPYPEIHSRIQREFNATVSNGALSNYFWKRRRETSRDIILFETLDAPTISQWSVQTAKLVLALRSRPQTRKQLRTLAAKHREKVEEKRRQLRARRRWKPKKKLAELPPFSQRKAWNVKLVLAGYYEATGAGLSPGYAESVACALWLLIFNKACNPKTIRRIVAKIEEAGGPDDLAPIEAYADQKSVPHRKKTVLQEAA